MKAKFFILATLLGGAFAFTSCDSDDNNDIDNGYTPGNAVVQAFSMKYPDAQRTSWESKVGYEKAEFYIGSYETEAWFDLQGNWVMTETDLPYDALPQAVKASFEAGKYASWEIDDVDKIERSDAGTVYIIEVENRDTDMDLYYAENGALIKEVIDKDNDDEHIPSVTPDAIKSVIQKLYPGAIILEVETEDIGIEVDILHENIHKEVWLDANNQWIRTKWEIAVSEVPDFVMEEFRASEYASYKIDEVYISENASGRWYIFELEQNDQDTSVDFGKK